jgi:hypothetical protein
MITKIKSSQVKKGKAGKRGRSSHEFFSGVGDIITFLEIPLISFIKKLIRENEIIIKCA